MLWTILTIGYIAEEKSKLNTIITLVGMKDGM